MVLTTIGLAMKKRAPIFYLFLIVVVVFRCAPEKTRNGEAYSDVKQRVIVCSDIGGTDPDDFQSMIHYLMYADRFQTEGLISSPFGKGRKEHILQIIDLYEKDFDALSKHGDFPDPNYLRSVTKQGAEKKAIGKGWGKSTEGSEWIIKKVKEKSDQPLWILVWGGLEDLAQALHDAPKIASKIKVYWIGGPNKKWSVHSYFYIASNFPDLWMIEANSTYRGWFIDNDAKPELKNDQFYKNQIMWKGNLGTDFGKYYFGSIKMGDTPSVAYLLNGDPDDPAGESWGGSFTKLSYSAYNHFKRHTSTSDTIPTYSVIEWDFDAGEFGLDESHEIWMLIDGQRIDGFYAGSGIFKVRFSPKRIGNWKYEIKCTSKTLYGQSGEFVSVNPWPGDENAQNMRLNNWWSDKTDEDLYLDQYQGAKTISKWREDYLVDWAKRFSWLSEK